MGTATPDQAAEAVRDQRTAAKRGGLPPKRRSAGRSEANSAARFFLGGASTAGKPGFDKECATESEALIESLRTGRTYFVLTEWKAVPDLTKRLPRISKEAVRADRREGGNAAAATSSGGNPASNRSS
jgi:hypothetical protein